MALIFADSFGHFEHPPTVTRPVRLFDEEMPAPRYPGVYTMLAKDDGTVEVVREYEGERYSRTLRAGQSAWGISWNGVSCSITDEAWERASQRVRFDS